MCRKLFKICAWTILLWSALTLSAQDKVIVRAKKNIGTGTIDVQVSKEDQRRNRERQGADRKRAEELRFIQESEQSRKKEREQASKDSIEHAEYADIINGDLIILESNKAYSNGGKTLWDCWDYSIQINADNTAVVLRYKKEKYNRSLHRDIKIPERVKLHNSFYYVTSIGNKAFEDGYIDNILLPKSLKRIGKSAFAHSSLRTINIPDAVIEIGDSAFYLCTNITRVVFPSSITRIGDSMFSDCNNLSVFKIPSSVQSIGSNAFRNCSKLLSIVLPKSVKSIGEDAFSGSCKKGINLEKGNLYYVIEDGLLLNHDKTLLLSVASIQLGYHLPSSIKRIGNGAFRGCEFLKSIEIPSSVNEIGEEAFSSSGIKTIYIPPSVNHIGRSVFNGCRKLTTASLHFSSDTIPKFLFNCCDSLIQIQIRSSVKVIGDFAFRGCVNLSDIILPDNLITIGNSAFQSCHELKELSVPSDVDAIGKAAFSGCMKLKKLSLPKSAKLGDGVFDYTDKLKTISFYLPNGTIENVPRKKYWQR